MWSFIIKNAVMELPPPRAPKTAGAQIDGLLLQARVITPPPPLTPCARIFPPPKQYKQRETPPPLAIDRLPPLKQHPPPLIPPYWPPSPPLPRQKQKRLPPLRTSFRNIGPGPLAEGIIGALAGTLEETLAELPVGNLAPRLVVRTVTWFEITANARVNNNTLRGNKRNLPSSPT